MPTTTQDARDAIIAAIKVLADTTAGSLAGATAPVGTQHYAESTRALAEALRAIGDLT
jgi:hypothetical protein